MVPHTTTPIMLDHMAWQPIVHLQSWHILGHEALARFTEGRSPLAVFEGADAHTQVLLDQQCVGRAVEEPPEYGLIFLNLTPATLRARHWPTIPDRLHHRVIWELPEAGGWQPDMIPEGMRVALDDIGTGYAELVRMSQVPWAFLKLDTSLVAGVAEDAGRQALIRELVLRAQARQGAIIAEGVESAHDAAVLRDLGVSYGQGYLWGHPQREVVWPKAAFEPVP